MGRRRRRKGEKEDEEEDEEEEDGEKEEKEDAEDEAKLYYQSLGLSVQGLLKGGSLCWIEYV